MNRFQLLAHHSDSSSQSSPQLDQALTQSEQRSGLHYTTFAPLHYEKNYSYPLLIWLHGPGDDERQLQRIMPLISMRNYVAIGLRATEADAANGRGFRWSSTDSGLFSAEQGIFECIDIASKKFHIARHRVFLGGYQCGGTTAFRLALKHPHHFAGVLSVGGPFPTGNRPLVHLNQIRQLPLFIAHCRDSASYPVEQTCDELRLFHAAGLHVTLRQYPCGDELDTQMLHDMDVWMMELITGISASTDDEVPTQPGEEN
jgi:phospholipase/carboxylesterase